MAKEAFLKFSGNPKKGTKIPKGFKMLPPRLKVVNAIEGEIRISNFPSPLCAEVEDMWQATMEHMEGGNNQEALNFCIRTINKLTELGLSL